MKGHVLFSGLFILMLASHGFSQNGQQPYRLLKTIPVEGIGYWDYLVADPATSRLFISHGTCVQVLDLKSEKLIATIPNTPIVHGITLVKEFGKGFISSGKSDSVIVFDLTDYRVLAKIPTGKHPDAIIYDPWSKRVFCFDSEGHDATVIDAATNNVAGQIPFPGNPEFAVSDGAGKMFVNIEDVSMIIKFDAKTLKIDAQWPLAPGKEPTGLAYDPVHKRLFSGCAVSRQLVVMNASNGKVITALPIGARCDGVAYIPEDHNIVTSNGEGTLTVIHQDSADKYSVIQTLTTKESARTITYDPSAGKLYIPASDIKVEGKKRMTVPESFGILVIGK